MRLVARFINQRPSYQDRRHKNGLSKRQFGMSLPNLRSFVLNFRNRAIRKYGILVVHLLDSRRPSYSIDIVVAVRYWAPSAKVLELNRLTDQCTEKM